MLYHIIVKLVKLMHAPVGAVDDPYCLARSVWTVVVSALSKCLSHDIKYWRAHTEEYTLLARSWINEIAEIITKLPSSSTVITAELKGQCSEFSWCTIPFKRVNFSLRQHLQDSFGVMPLSYSVSITKSSLEVIAAKRSEKPINLWKLTRSDVVGRTVLFFQVI
jgi:hypothetical protein